MKKYCFYLPQFHEIEENNKWWGNGFTEWTKVKSAKSLMENHLQPKVPLNYNYYNLLNIDTVKWQTSLMAEYKIDGLIYYHYYFKGRKLLEKPAEQLLNNKDIKQNFFFCWANHSWYKSWEGKKELLLKQEYGDEEDWEKHFQYLLMFFCDERYVKRNNKPVFMIYKPDFLEKKDMFDFFNKRCIEYGFSGLSLIETCDDVRSSRYSNIINNLNDCTDAVFYREPSVGLSIYSYSFSVNRVLKFIKKKMAWIFHMNYFNIYVGDELLEYSMLFQKKISNVKSISGLFFEWDNTPRHSYRGYVINPISHKTFKKYMEFHRDDEYLFINAWNEWAEGMMLEPTEENGYKYLEWIKEWTERNG